MTVDLSPATSSKKDTNPQRPSGQYAQDASAFSQTFSGLLQRGQANAENEMRSSIFNDARADPSIEVGLDTGHIPDVASELEVVTYKEFATDHAFSFEVIGLLGEAGAQNIKVTDQPTGPAVGVSLSTILNDSRADSGIEAGSDTGHVLRVLRELEVVAHKEFATDHGFSFEAIGSLGKASAQNIKVTYQQTEGHAVVVSLSTILNDGRADSGIKIGSDVRYTPHYTPKISNELELIAYREFATHHAFSFEAIGLLGRSTIRSIKLVGQQKQSHAKGPTLLPRIDADRGAHIDAGTLTMMVSAGVPTSSHAGMTPYTIPASNEGQVKYSALVRVSDMQAPHPRADAGPSTNENQDSHVRRQAKLVASRIATSVARAGVTRIEISLGVDGRKLNVRIRAGGLAKTDIAALEDDVKSLLKEFGFEIGSIVIEYENVDSGRLISKGLQDGRN